MAHLNSKLTKNCLKIICAHTFIEKLQHLDDSVLWKYRLKKLKNTGRYYIAKIIEADGRLIDQFMIDKQSEKIQSFPRTNGNKD